jgi:hypothetical protein
MNTETAQRMNSRTEGALAANAQWQTPPEVFAKLQQDFGPFDVDLFASPDTALLPQWFGPGSPLAHCEDALQVPWSAHWRQGYGNPPYGAFVQRALAHARRMKEDGFDSTLLLPFRVTQAFQTYVMHGAAQVYICDRRIIFNEFGSPRLDRLGRPMPAMFDSMIVRYMHGYHNARPIWDMWRVPAHGKVKR